MQPPCCCRRSCDSTERNRGVPERALRLPRLQAVSGLPHQHSPQWPSHAGGSSGLDGTAMRPPVKTVTARASSVPVASISGARAHLRHAIALPPPTVVATPAHRQEANSKSRREGGRQRRKRLRTLNRGTAPIAALIACFCSLSGESVCLGQGNMKCGGPLGAFLPTPTFWFETWLNSKATTADPGPRLQR